ncbi:MAG TPA: competence/damage-inducible protein A [Bacteroidia bacterium]|jgi:nicotinamide-nucleotide amidase|nr:competence/damage-inducible protein A [Bacteroidia bacterium]
MLAEIITIGDEILIGQIVDTNSAWLGTELSNIGISVKQITSVSDDKQHILEALALAEKRADIIVITGGLGPTKDDITKHTLCEYFKTSLVMNEAVLKHVTAFFEKRNRPMLEVNIKQAEVPVNCEILFNNQGTAPGMWFKHNNKIFISMPGVPFEMKGIMRDFGFDKLKQTFTLPFIYHRTILTQGLGESFLADKIKDWEDGLTPKEIKLAYLPSPGMVKLRLTAKGDDKQKLKATVDAEAVALYKIVGEYIYGEEELGKAAPTFQSIVGEALSKKNKTIAVAESCTGGYISHLITSIAGSSAYYKGSVVAYENEIKVAELNVKKATLDTYGAVSVECAKEMACGILKKFDTDYAIATTGIAGPTGETHDKPIGTVCIAIATKTEVIAQKFIFGNDRVRNIHMAADMALNMLNKAIK